MRKMILLFSFLVLFSCQKTDNNCVLYYFEEEMFHSMLSLDCNDIFKLSGLRKIDIDDEKLIEDISNIRDYVQKDETYNPDVRYKIIFKKDTLCIGYTSNFILNNKDRGTIIFLKELEEFIKVNEKRSTPVTTPTHKPYLK